MDAPGAAPREISGEEASRLRDDAFEHLRAAVRLGYADPDLAPLRADPRWEDLRHAAEAGGR